MSPTLRLTREARGIELRRGRFEVLVHGTRVQSFDRNETIRASCSSRVTTPSEYRQAVFEPRPIVRRGERRSHQLSQSRSHDLANVRRFNRQAESVAISLKRE